jgi:hypothetical protein
MKAHLIRDGRVVNTIVVNALNDMPGLIDATLGGQIGNLWDGHIFIESPEQIAERETQEAEAAFIAGKAQAIADNLPSWAEVDAVITAYASLADAKVVLRKLARVVYVLAKNSLT